MRKYWQQFQLENKFLYKNWFFLITPILYLFITVIWMANRNYYPNHDFLRSSYEFLSLGHTITLGIVFLASVLSIRRDSQTELLEWMNTLPHSYLSKLLAKFSSIFLYTNIFSVVFLIPYFLLGKSYTDFSILQKEAISILLQSQIAYSVTIVLGMTLAAFITHRIVYIIVFCAWMFGTFFMEGFIMERYNLFIFKVFHLNKFFLSNTYQYGWSINLQQTEKMYAQIFVIGFTILLFFITLLKLMSKRLMNKKSAKLVSISLVAIVACSTFIPYSMFWKDRLQNHHYLVNGVKEQSDNESVLFPSETYKIDMKRKQDTILLESKVTLQKTNQQPFTFTLYPNFEIEDVIWNGKSVHFDRDFQFITFEEEELEENNLVVKYSGELNEWTTIGGRERLLAFIEGSDMFLPSNIAWYPIIGQYKIFQLDYYTAQENLSLSNLSNSNTFYPSDFHVSLTGFAHEVFGTYEEKEITEDNTMVVKSNNRTGLTLFSMDGLTETSLSSVPISIVTKVEQMKKLIDNSLQLNGMYDYLSDWLPIQSSMPTLISLPGLQLTGSDPFYANTRDSSLFYDMQMELGYYNNDEWMDQTADYYITEIINIFLFPENPRKLYGDYVEYRQDSVTVGIAHGYILLTLVDFFGKDWDYFDNYYTRSHYMLNELGNITWFSNNSSLSNEERIKEILKSQNLFHDYNSKVLFEIALALETGKKEQVKEVLAFFYDEILDTPYITYSEWKQKWDEVENNLD
ncbi:hypothetical protein [Bacillus sp. FJAT-45066]|uniref:hypothetical protein n=1 Tax=Bacillus sp. FJAT-45066 TaxID=2011010 RepID=UPI000BB93D5D|nr:hypothetical protein [Bacillus sp. FJAT-45066]